MATKAKRFRIGVEGATTDGRMISREWLVQMAAQYDPAVYGARINMEHIKGYTPDSPFRRYGDVTALTAEEITEGALAGKMALYADIDPTPELVALTQARQKIYTSMEVNPEFADTGKAYLVGLAVTDDPASLGTEMLSFSARAQLNPLAARKQDTANLFTAAEETLIEFEQVADPAPSLLERVTALFAAKKKTDAERFTDVNTAVTAVAEQVQQSADEAAQQFTVLETALTSRLEALEQQSTEDRAAVQALTEQLAQTDGSFSRRSRASGADAHAGLQTDC
ncbi:GPO family capsid scaffolding protein [Nissabacter sp. SGAir0207]|uniref:GPO family capsid scaffolding protein n=1 Tax=Nissabacter sp. SGAir0207 TaxID=2126321 RepID=UPI0010CCC9BA|nr:GPO family capsid scaffolding protein [Nissabacter sp. SGAir0207]QCR38015.1 GPO family capsid scaffolding protein [Nissabacter sp. SGAir0207]